MPSNTGVGLDDEQDRTPTRHRSAKTTPRRWGALSEMRPLRLSLQNRKKLRQRKILSGELASDSDDTSKRFKTNLGNPANAKSSWPSGSVVSRKTQQS